MCHIFVTKFIYFHWCLYGFVGVETNITIGDIKQYMSIKKFIHARQTIMCAKLKLSIWEDKINL